LIFLVLSSSCTLMFFSFLYFLHFFDVSAEKNAH